MNGQSHTFGYDPMGNLRYADYGGSHQYFWSYDTMGNRRKSGGDGVETDYTYDTLSNRLLTATHTDSATGNVLSVETGSYDTEGNLTRWGGSDNSTYYQWNVRGELVGVNGGGSATPHVGTFAYDAFGRRQGQFGESIPQVWEGWGDANPFAHDLSPDKVFDPAGSLLATLNGPGNPPASTQSYLPFGEPVNSGKAEFAGMYGDPISGLYYARNRYYHPGMGRFISEDPIGLAGGANLYAYCHNDPINFSDPSGLSPYFGMEFDKEGVEEGLKTGVAAVATAGSDMITGFVNGSNSLVQMGLVPPMEPLYDGGAYKCKPGFGVSRVLGRIGLEAGLAAATIGEAGAVSVKELWSKAGQLLKGGGCFVAGTPVLMADGSYKPIEQVKETDKVQARDTITGTGRTEGKQVTSTSVRYVDTTLVLGFNTGATIETTDEHPFFEVGKGFVPAKSLGIGSEIVTRAGPNLVVTSIERKNVRTKVYNFTVGGEDENFHSYFVGDPQTTNGGLWVHNIPCSWNPTRKLSGVLSAFKHWKDHGAEFPELQNALQYARKHMEL